MPYYAPAPQGEDSVKWPPARDSGSDNKDGKSCQHPDYCQSWLWLLSQVIISTVICQCIKRLKKLHSSQTYQTVSGQNFDETGLANAFASLNDLKADTGPAQMQATSLFAMHVRNKFTTLAMFLSPFRCEWPEDLGWWKHLCSQNKLWLWTSLLVPRSEPWGQTLSVYPCQDFQWSLIMATSILCGLIAWPNRCPRSFAFVD